MGLESRYRPVKSGAKSLLGMAALAAVFNGAALMAQDEPNGVDSGVPTLHVYTNTIQIPTLVLTMTTSDLVRKPIEESRFSVSIDSGPWFRATHVRQEGDDPISLSILLDVSGDAAGLMSRIGDALGKLAPLSLRPGDRVSVYALDCSLFRTLNNAPVDSVLLRQGVENALQSWTQRKGKREESCEHRVHLWDGLGQVAVNLSNLPGRRVILVVTDGEDTGSKHTWNEVRDFAQATGTAVFGLNFARTLPMGVETYGRGRGGYLASGGGPFVVVESPLISVCELSGGIVMRMNDAASLPATLERFVKMLRERYIVEFPRPANSTAGQHGMEVKIAKGSYLIRPSGVSLPVPDAALLADPTTIQAGPSQTPEQGKRKVMAKPQ
jgi:hypothetical protein